MLIIPGARALSPFRLRKLGADIEASGLDLAVLETRYIHLVDFAAQLSADEIELLNELLQYGQVSRQNNSFEIPDDSFRLVVPRRGTTSPWSSKATDIARIVGIKKIRRIERGIGYWLSGAANERLLPLIHDRMTEEVLNSTDAAFLFNHHEYGPLRSVPVLEQGSSALSAANMELGMALTDDEIDYLQTAFA